MGAAAPAIAIGASLFQGISAANADEAKTAAEGFQSQENARLAERAAVDAQQIGAVNAGKIRTVGSKLVSAQKVAYANSGVDSTVGTPVSVMADTQAQTELEARTAEVNAAKEAWGLRKTGAKFNQQAHLEAKAQEARTTGTILGTAGNIAGLAGKYYSE